MGWAFDQTDDLRDANAELARLRAKVSRLERERDIARGCAVRLNDIWRLRGAAEWREHHGPVLWWRTPIEGPPWVGTPLDDDWPDIDPPTHWTPIPVPAPPVNEPAGLDAGDAGEPTPPGEVHADGYDELVDG